MGVESGTPSEVDNYVVLWNEFVPHVEWKVWVCATKHCYEAVFVSADGTFCFVSSMDVRGYFLQIHLTFIDNVVLENGGAFIVKFTEFRTQSRFA